MDILLLSLPREGECQDNLTPKYIMVDFMNYPPLGLLAIAADVDSRHTIEVLDSDNERMTIDQVVEHVVAKKPDILGVSVVTWRLYPMREITQRVKQACPETVIVAGGPHANDYPKEILELGAVDIAVTGFGEKKFPKIVEALDQGKALDAIDAGGIWYKKGDEICSTPPDQGRVDLDEFSFPARHLIDVDDYFTLADEQKMTTMYSSRGCPYKCVFCDVALKKYYTKSGIRIVDEFEKIAALGINEVHIFDDTFNLDRQRVMDMCNEILRRGLKIHWSARARVTPCDEEMMQLMKKAGCRRLHVGVESLDDGLLEEMKKYATVKEIQFFFDMCKKYKIDTLVYIIVGFENETKDYRRNLLKNLKKLHPTYIYINKLQPLNGTEFYRKLLERGDYENDFWDEFIKNPVRDYHIPSFRTPDENHALDCLVDELHRNFYLSPGFIIKDLLRTRSIKLLWRKAKVAITMMMHKIGFRDA